MDEKYEISGFRTYFWVFDIYKKADLVSEIDFFQKKCWEIRGNSDLMTYFWVFDIYIYKKADLASEIDFSKKVLMGIRATLKDLCANARAWSPLLPCYYAVGRVVECWPVE